MNVTLTATEIVNRLFNGAVESTENRVAVVEGILEREQRADLYNMKRTLREVVEIERRIDLLLEKAHAAGYQVKTLT